MRHRYLVAYDIAEPKRGREVHRLMLGHGTRVQYSVFVCCLSRSERIELEAKLADVVHLREDRVLLANLGPDHGGGLDEIDFLGPHPVFDRPGPQIF